MFSKRIDLSTMPLPNRFDVPVLLLGESHVNAIAVAIKKDGIANIVAIDVRNKAAGRKVDIDAFTGYRPRNLVLAFGGTEHNILGLIEADPKFDFVWPSYDDCADDRTLIPSVAIEALLRERIAPAVERAIYVRSLFARFNCEVHALAPPFPFLAIDERSALPALFAPLIEIGIAPAALRRKLYAMLIEVMTEAYAAYGIDLIPAPKMASDDQGYLLRHCWNRDPTHGNRSYGRLVIDHLRTHIDV